MFGTGTSPMRGTIRRLSGVTSIGAALLLLVGGLTVFGSDSIAGASTKTTVSSFAAKPTSLASTGGTVTLSAKVSGAKTCAFSVTPTIKGLPATKSCTSSTVTEKVTVPKNTGTKAITDTFSLSVTGSTTVKATPIKVTVAKPPAPPKPTVTSFTASPPTLQSHGGFVTLTAATTHGGLCNIAASPRLDGFTRYTTCITGHATGTAFFGINIGSTPETYTFTVTVKAASGTATAKKTVKVTEEPPPSSLTISPTTSNIAPGDSQTYVVTGYDQDGKSLGIDTAAGPLTITGAGPGPASCDGFTCTASGVGSYTVTAEDDAVRVDATLNVEPLASLTLSPTTSSILPGDSQKYVVTGNDSDGNSLGPDKKATLAITPNGSCEGLTCTASHVGSHTVTATDGTATGQATLTVVDCSNLVPHADLEGCTFFRPDLPNIDLTGANLTDTIWTAATLTGANLTDANLTAARFISGAFLTNANFTGATLWATDFEGSPLTNANFTGATLTDILLGGSALTNANFTGATLTGTGFDSSLTNPNFTGATLINTEFDGSDLTNATLTGVSSFEITGTPSGLPADWILANGYLIGPGADLSDADLFGVDLSGADLSGADLTGVSSGEIIGTPSGLPADWILVNGYLIGPGADLSDADLSGADLFGIDLSGADLSGADLTGVSSGEITGTPSGLPADWILANGYLIGPGADLSDADLSGANLSGVDLSTADLSGVNLTDADLTDANLTDADLTDADLSGATLTGITWSNTTCPDGTNSVDNGNTCVNDLLPS